MNINCEDLVFDFNIVFVIDFELGLLGLLEVD